MSTATLGILLTFIAVFSACYLLLTRGLPRRLPFGWGAAALVLMLLPLYRPASGTLAGTLLRYVLFEAVYWAWSLIFLKIRPRYALYLSSFCTVFMGVWYSCTQVLFSLSGFRNSVALTVTTGVCRVASIILLRNFLIRVDAERDITIHQLLLSLFPSVACFIANLALFEYAQESTAISPFSTGLLVLFFGFAAMLVLVSSEYYFRMEQLKKENALAQSRLDAQYRQFLTEKRNDERARALQHDMRNHLNTLSGMLRSSDSGKANAYIEELRSAITDTEAEVHTGNATLDALLLTKKRLCEEKGIRLVNYLSVGGLEQFTPMEICTLFANCIDNAVEALSHDDVPEKTLRLSGGLTHGSLIVKIENPYAHPLQTHNGTFETTKKDRELHGYGLKNVEEIIRRHGGTLTVRTDRQIFSVVWMVPEEK